MNSGYETTPRRSGRMEWISYGFLAGMVCGVLIGWFFAGFIGAFIRVGIAALVIIPLILLFLAWRKFISPILRPAEPTRSVPAPAVIDTTAVVHGTSREPMPR